MHVKNRKMIAAIALTFAAGILMAAEPFVEVIEVVPNKILYKDNEAGQAKVRLANPFEREVEVTLKPTLLCDLEESVALKPVTVKVPAKGNAEADVSWPAVKERWGHEIMVAAVVDGKTVDRGRQFFGVNSDWMDMILISFARRWDNLLVKIDPFSHYSTVSHWFAWAPGDYTENAPAYDEWWSGQVGYHTFKKDIQESIKKCHEKGIHCTFYNNSFSGGKAGLEWARRHPEWVCRNRDGSPMLSGSALAMTKPYSDKSTGQMGQVLIDFYDEKVIEWGARNVIDSIKMFGWDGMFWDCGGCPLFPGFSYDGQPTPHGNPAPDELSARNFRMFHEIVRKEFPHFGVWINGSARHWKQSFWSRFGNCGGMTTAKEQFSTPQTGLLIEHRGHDQPGSQFNNWQHCYDVYVEERDTVTQPWGAPIIAGYTTPWNWRAESHLAALILACQMRPANCHQEGTWPMTQFMTRYSSILWQRDVKVIPDPEKVLAVETTRPVWWKKFVYRRPVKGGEDILVHMVSIPDTENVVITQKDNPPGMTGKVVFTVPAGRKVRKVYALQPRIYRPGVDSKTGIGLDVGGAPATVVQEPDPKDPAKKVWVHRTGSLVRGGPSQVELKAVVNNGKATVDVPEFVYHALIVFRLEEN